MPRKGDPSPRDVMLDKIEASRAMKHPRRMISVNWNDALYLIVLRAAKRRGLSKSAYVRRAAAAMAAHDLGLDYYQVMRGERGTMPWGVRGGRPEDQAESKDGLGYGVWSITGVEGPRGESE
jgi:hypothetical protein